MLAASKVRGKHGHTDTDTDTDTDRHTHTHTHLFRVYTPFIGLRCTAVQERLTKQIAEVLMSVLKPTGCAVVIEAQCVVKTPLGEGGGMCMQANGFAQTQTHRRTDTDAQTQTHTHIHTDTHTHTHTYRHIQTHTHTHTHKHTHTHTPLFLQAHVHADARGAEDANEHDNVDDARDVSR